MGTLERRPTDQKSNVSVVVNFLSQVIFIFLFFQLHLHTYHTPKQKNKKITGDEKLTTTYPPT